MSQGTPSLAATLGALRPLWWAGVSGSRQGEASRFYQTQKDQDLAVSKENSALVEHVREKIAINSFK